MICDGIEDDRDIDDRDIDEEIIERKINGWSY